MSKSKFSSRTSCAYFGCFAPLLSVIFGPCFAMASDAGDNEVMATSYPSPPTSTVAPPSPSRCVAATLKPAESDPAAARAIMPNLCKLDTLALAFQHHRAGSPLQPVLPIEQAKTEVRLILAASVPDSSSVPSPPRRCVSSSVENSPAVPSAKHSLPRAPYFVTLAPVKKNTPPSLVLEIADLSEVVDAFARYEEALDDVFGIAIEEDVWSEDNEDEHSLFGCDENYLQEEETRVSVFDRLGPVGAVAVDSIALPASIAPVVADKSSSPAKKPSVFDRLGPVGTAAVDNVSSPAPVAPVTVTAEKPSSPAKKLSVFDRLGSIDSNSGPSSGNATPMSEEGAVVSLNEAATEAAGAAVVEERRKPTRRAGKKRTAQRMKQRNAQAQ